MPHVEANGIRIEYERMGLRNAPAVLLVMGLGAQLTAWDERLCRGIAEAGYQVVRYDNRDVGLSRMFDAECPKPMSLMPAVTAGEEVSLPYSLRDMADDAAGLLDALELESVHVVGASMGGMIAQRLAIHHEHRVRTLTSIMSTTGNPDLPAAAPEVIGMLMAPAPDDEEEALQAGVERSRVLFGGGFPFDAEEVRERLRGTRARSLNQAGMMRQMLAIRSDGDRRGGLRGLSTPTLVIHGADDPLVPIAGGHDTAEAIPGAEMLVVEGMGHSMPEGAWPRMFEAMTALWDSGSSRAGP